MLHTGAPSGLTTTLPLALAELKKAAPDGAKIMLGFGRGGAYAQVFRHCREQGADWVTYRRAPLAVRTGLPVLSVITVNGQAGGGLGRGDRRAEGLRRGPAADLVRARPGRAAGPDLRFDACPAEILAWLKSRWREENFLKYAAENYGIDRICDYAAAVETNTKVTGNPARKAANAAVQRADKTWPRPGKTTPPCSPTRPSPPPRRTPG